MRVGSQNVRGRAGRWRRSSRRSSNGTVIGRDTSERVAVADCLRWRAGRSVLLARLLLLLQAPGTQDRTGAQRTTDRTTHNTVVEIQNLPAFLFSSVTYSY